MLAGLKSHALVAAISLVIYSGNSYAAWIEVADKKPSLSDQRIFALPQGGMLRIEVSDKKVCKLDAVRAYLSDGGGLLAEMPLLIDKQRCVAFQGDFTTSPRHLLLAGDAQLLSHLRVGYWSKKKPVLLESGWRPISKDHAHTLQRDAQHHHATVANAYSFAAQASTEYLFRHWSIQALPENPNPVLLPLRLKNGESLKMLDDPELLDDTYALNGCTQNLLRTHERVLFRSDAQAVTLDAPPQSVIQLQQPRTALWDKNYWSLQRLPSSTHNAQTQRLQQEWLSALAQGRPSAGAAASAALRVDASNESLQDFIRANSFHRDISISSNNSQPWLFITPRNLREFNTARRAMDSNTITSVLENNRPVAFTLLKPQASIELHSESSGGPEDYRLRVAVSESPKEALVFRIRRGDFQRDVFLHPQLLQSSVNIPTRDDHAYAFSERQDTRMHTASLSFGVPASDEPIEIQRLDTSEPVAWINIQQRVGRSIDPNIASLEFMRESFTQDQLIELFNPEHVSYDPHGAYIQSSLMPLRSWIKLQLAVLSNDKTSNAGENNTAQHVRHWLSTGDTESLKQILLALQAQNHPDWQIALATLFNLPVQASKHSTDQTVNETPQSAPSLVPVHSKGMRLALTEDRRLQTRFFTADAKNPSIWSLQNGKNYRLRLRWMAADAKLQHLILRNADNALDVPVTAPLSREVRDGATDRPLSVERVIVFQWQGTDGLVEIQPAAGETLIAVEPIEIAQSTQDQARDIDPQVISMRADHIEQCSVSKETISAPVTYAPRANTKVQSLAAGSFRIIAPAPGSADSNTSASISSTAAATIQTGWDAVLPINSVAYRFLAMPNSKKSDRKKRFELSTKDSPVEYYFREPAQIRLIRSYRGVTKTQELDVSAGRWQVPDTIGNEEFVRVEQKTQKTGITKVSALRSTSSNNIDNTPKPLVFPTLTSTLIKPITNIGNDESLYRPAIRALPGTWSIGSSWNDELNDDGEGSNNADARWQWQASWRQHPDFSAWWWRADFNLHRLSSSTVHGISNSIDFEPSNSPWRGTAQLEYWQQSLSSGQKIRSAQLSAEIGWQQSYDALFRHEPYARVYWNNTNGVTPSSNFNLIDPALATRYSVQHDNGWQLGYRFAHRPRVDFEWNAEAWVRGNPFGQADVLDQYGVRTRASAFYRGVTWRAGLEHRLLLNDQDRSRDLSRTTISLDAGGVHKLRAGYWWAWGIGVDYPIQSKQTGLQLGIRIDRNGDRGWNDFRPRETVFRDLYQRVLNDDALAP